MEYLKNLAVGFEILFYLIIALLFMVLFGAVCVGVMFLSAWILVWGILHLVYLIIPAIIIATAYYLGKSTRGGRQS